MKGENGMGWEEGNERNEEKKIRKRSQEERWKKGKKERK